MPNKAIFFDRDGTLNVDVHYLHEPADFVWVEGAIEAIRWANEHGYLVIVITNQSGIARGYYDEDAVHHLHRWMNAELTARGAHIDAFYYCPHHPEGRVPAYTRACDCRKPAPGMILRAMAEHDIDPAASWMFGDAQSDVIAADRAGVRGVHYAGGSLLACVREAVEAGVSAGRR
ncbi:D-glycero-beta-D-manno-heptose 1,7-bisphosphate 7-phosphatase [uncultured Selenomonas sp.]|uniref:D-glycero-beta-D-manno-heptose 1,7-bisphosphate 7-phosphatase n=1 Tax=uncultured Selenomonas sp. TaxID=159275 RepID=UPI0028E1C968|nr:D-glycero-beta-D-manno-heptose 1,7-bisphosphate 7-phosphatase [uncultured Selenomonas sp.]